MSSFWAAYYGDALVLTEKEFDDFCEKYAQVNKLEKEDMFEDSIRGYNFKKGNDPEETFTIVDILSDYADGKYFVPFFTEGIPNEAVYDEDDKLIKRAVVSSWREHDCYAIFAEHNRYSGRAFLMPPYSSYKEFVQEFKDKLEKYLPEDFDWDGHLGCFSYAAYA